MRVRQLAILAAFVALVFSSGCDSCRRCSFHRRCFTPCAPACYQPTTCCHPGTGPVAPVAVGTPIAVGAPVAVGPAVAVPGH